MSIRKQGEFFITKQASFYERRVATAAVAQQQRIKFPIDKEFMKFASRQPRSNVSLPSERACIATKNEISFRSDEHANKIRPLCITPRCA